MINVSIRITPFLSLAWVVSKTSNPWFAHDQRSKYACVESTITIIIFKQCVLNAEFQYFILRFNKISLLCVPLKKGIGAEREDDFENNFNVLQMLVVDQTWLINEHGVVQRGFEKLGRMPDHI